MYNAVLNKKSNSADLVIYEDIGGGWFGGVTAKMVADDLKSFGNIDTINLRLSTPGGSVIEGNTIYNILKQHKAKVITHVDGVAASIGSVIALAGDEINIAENAMFMIHEPWGMAIGSADEMRKEADVIAAFRETIMAVYIKETTSSQEDLDAWMSEETWMDAEQSIDRGFAHSMVEEQRIAASIDARRYHYRNTPAGVLAPAAEKPRSAGMRPAFARMQKSLQQRKLFRI